MPVDRCVSSWKCEISLVHFSSCYLRDDYEEETTLELPNYIQLIQARGHFSLKNEYGIFGFSKIPGFSHRILGDIFPRFVFKKLPVCFGFSRIFGILYGFLRFSPDFRDFLNTFSDFLTHCISRFSGGSTENRDPTNITILGKTLAKSTA